MYITNIKSLSLYFFLLKLSVNVYLSISEAKYELVQLFLCETDDAGGKTSRDQCLFHASVVPLATNYLFLWLNFFLRVHGMSQQV